MWLLQVKKENLTFFFPLILTDLHLNSYMWLAVTVGQCNSRLRSKGL